MIRRAPALLLTLIALAGASAAVAAQDDVTIYRCTDAGGKLALQDKPCAKGQAQQTRQMQKLKDPPPKAAPPTAAFTAAPTPAPPPSVVVVRTPQPMYECVRDDNSVYTSDDGEGDPRWVSAWDGYDGYPYIAGRNGIGVSAGVAMRQQPSRGDGGASTHGDGGGQGGSGTPQIRLRDVPSTSPPPSRPPRPPRPGHGYGDGYGAAGSWVRDPCHALPQREVCDRLVDRRDDIRRRFFNAQPSERAVLSREERGIDARLAADCGVP